MTRTPPPPLRHDLTTDEDRRAFDEVTRVRARQMNADATSFEVTGYYGALLNSPPYARAQIAAAIALRSVGNREGSYSHADREWVDQVLSHELGYYGVLGMHTRDAIALGVRPEAIEALWEGRPDELTEDERLLERYVRQVVTGTVDPETWARMLARLGQRGLVEYTTFIGHLLVVLRMHQALGIEGDLRSRQDVLDVVRRIRAGEIEMPDQVDAVRVGR